VLNDDASRAWAWPSWVGWGDDDDQDYDDDDDDDGGMGVMIVWWRRRWSVVMMSIGGHWRPSGCCSST